MILLNTPNGDFSFQETEVITLRESFEQPAETEIRFKNGTVVYVRVSTKRIHQLICNSMGEE